MSTGSSPICSSSAGSASSGSKIYDPRAAQVYGVHDRYLAHLCLTGAADLVDLKARLLHRRAAATGSPFTPAPPPTGTAPSATA